MKTIREHIEHNDKEISTKAYIKHFEAALHAADYIGVDNTDLRVSRIQAYCSVLYRINAIDSVKNLYREAESINQYREQFDYKPDGMDALVKTLKDHFLDVCLDVGLGTEQLKAVAYSFDLDTLKEEKLLYLRKRDSE